MILSLLATATWQLAGWPAGVGAGTSGLVARRPHGSQSLTSLLLGQCVVRLGLLVYALLIGPLLPHDGVGGFLAGILTGVMMGAYRRSRSF